MNGGIHSPATNLSSNTSISPLVPLKYICNNNYNVCILHLYYLLLPLCHYSLFYLWIRILHSSQTFRFELLFAAQALTAVTLSSAGQ